MVGTRNYVFKLEIHFLNVLKHRKMEINSDVLMSSTHMKCGAQTTSEECTLKNFDRILLNLKFTIENKLQSLTKANKQSSTEDGLIKRNDQK